MNSVNPQMPLFLGGLVFIALALLTPLSLLAEEDFSFTVEEYSKQPLAQYGYLEGRWEHADRNQESVLTALDADDGQASMQDMVTGILQYGGSYVRANIGGHWLLTAMGRVDDAGWIDSADVYETYIDVKAGSHLTAAAGKKSTRWGKGYAWNPTGFINRPKDPNDPEEALEGYGIAEADIVKSCNGPLRTTALTAILLPVWQGVNDDFGREDGLNLAAKLYLLYRDTDIDLQFFTGGSRSTRYGADFSRNLSTNFEIHGELAYLTETDKTVLSSDSQIEHTRDHALSWLLGLRYLTAFDLTSIIEYYHNGAGYSEEELSRFYTLINKGTQQWDSSRADTILNQARQLSLQGYARPNPGTDYLYTRFSLKEPFDLLYFTPALTVIANLNDHSFSATPECIYTGFTNWELRLRFSLLSGEPESEFGEKLNGNKLELRLRYFF